MKAIEYRQRARWKRARWALAISLTSGSLGALLAIAHLHAGPMEVPLLQKNKSSQPVTHAAAYVPGKLWAYILRSEPDNAKSAPIVFLVGELVTQLILPDSSTLTESKAVVFSYVRENDLKVFPWALELVHREEGIIANRIDSVTTEMGLQQLKDVYDTAHGRTDGATVRADDLKE